MTARDTMVFGGTTAEVRRAVAIMDAPGVGLGLRQAEDDQRSVAPVDVRAALRSHVVEQGERYSVASLLEYVGPWSPPVEVLEAALAIITESIANAVRHGRATSVRVSVDGVRGLVAIRDDGRGFNPMIRPPGHGLGRMRATAAAAGGHLVVRSVRHEGTTVHVSFG